VTLSINDIPQWAYPHSEFIGQLDDGFPQPLIVRFKTDISFQALEEKLDNKNGSKQRLKLTERCF